MTKQEGHSQIRISDEFKGWIYSKRNLGETYQDALIRLLKLDPKKFSPKAKINQK